MDAATFSFPTTVHSGAGARRRLRDHLRAAGVRRPLVVTDAGVAALPFFQAIVDSLHSGGGLSPRVFAEVRGNPRAAVVVQGEGAFREIEADGLVAVGGGAAHDVAKAIGLAATQPGHIFDYAEDAEAPRAMTSPMPFFVALPTTAGTGSEVGRSAVISEDDTGRKRVIFQPPLLPDVVLADPELLVGLPPGITAATGMDALCHLVEAFLAKGYHPMCDGIALEGLRLVAEGLARSVEEPADLQARSSMLMASMMGAVAFQKGLGVTHACAHALSAVLDVHHGLANGVLMPAALRFNAEVCGARLARMARAIELSDPTAEGFIGWVQQLQASIGIPASLGELGVREEHLDELAALAHGDGRLLTNPRPATTAELRELLQSALA